MIEVVDGSFDDPMVVLLDAALNGEPINTTFAIYRVEQFGVNEELPPWT